MRLINSISIFYHGFRLLINPGDNIKSLLFLSDKIAQAKASKETVRMLFKNEIIREMFENRIGLENLKSYREGSFGK